MSKANRMKKDEMQILKSVTVKLDDETAAIVTYQYHVEENAEGKHDLLKSRYRYLVRVSKIKDIEAEVQRMMQDAVRLTPWKWPDDPTWDGKIYTDDSTMYRASTWLRMRLKKMVSWEDGVKILNGYSKLKGEYNKNAAYKLDGYSASDGTTGIKLDDKDELLKHVGQNLWAENQLKTQVKALEKAKASSLEEKKDVA